ncbi:hypothetical protein [Pseudomonas sp. NPDC096950]|uniref:hypothetical protein n=1 Tax=Pseudomonas sp. NPDC096950 TaxID=3364485 RepID=UPI00383AECC3
MSKLVKSDLQGKVVACPICRNDQLFIVTTAPMTAEQCEVFLVCKCGYDPTFGMEVVRNRISLTASDEEKTVGAVESWKRGIDFDIPPDRFEEWKLVSGCKRLAELLPNKSPFWMVWRSAVLGAHEAYKAVFPDMTVGTIAGRWESIASRGFLDVGVEADGALLVTEADEPMSDAEIEDWAREMVKMFKDDTTFWPMWRNALLAEYPAYKRANQLSKLHTLAQQWTFLARAGILEVEFGVDRAIRVHEYQKSHLP